MKRVIPKDESYKVIHIERDPVEVSASHEKFIEINGILPHRTIEDIEAEVEQTKEYLKDMDVLYMRYGDIIKNPAWESRRIAVFLWMDLDIQAMANVVDLHLYRNRNVFMMRKEKSSDAS